MATIYVSNEAINGYIVGSDTAPGNGSAANPYLTIAKGVSMCSAAGGDTLMVNGTLYSANSFTFDRPLSLQPTVAYETTLRTTNATRCIHISHTRGGTNTIGAFYLDSNNTSQLCVQVSTSAVAYTLVMNGTRLINLKNYGVGTLSGNVNVTATLTDVQMTSTNTAFVNGVTWTTLVGGSVTIDGLVYSATGVDSGTSAPITLSASVAGVGCTIRNSTFTHTMSTTAATRTVYGTLLQNIPNVQFYNNTVNVTTTKTQHTVDGLYLTTVSASPLSAASPVIYGNTFNLNSAATGHAMLIGKETPDGINDNLTNNALIYNNTVNINDTAGAAGYHGIMLGNNQGGEVYGNTVTGGMIGYLAKYQSGSRWHNNTSSNIAANGQHFRCKAATAYFYRNHANSNTSYPGKFLVATEDAAAPSFVSVMTAEDNVLSVPDDAIVYGFSITGGSTGKFSGNTYSGSNTQFDYNGVNYTKSTMPSLHVEVVDWDGTGRVSASNTSGEYE